MSILPSWVQASLFLRHFEKRVSVSQTLVPILGECPFMADDIKSEFKDTSQESFRHELVRADQLRSCLIPQWKLDELGRRGKSRVAHFYRSQNELVRSFLAARNHTNRARNDTTTDSLSRLLLEAANRMTKLSFFLNVFLFIIKVFAAVWSKSLSVLASTVDSLLDLASGFVLWFSNRAMRKFDVYKYPEARFKLEPLSVVIFCAVMGIVRQSFQFFFPRRHIWLESFNRPPFS